MKSIRKLWPMIPLLLLAACEGGRFQSTAASDTTSTPTSQDQVVNPPTPVDPSTPGTPPPAPPLPLPPVDDGTVFKECNGNPDLPFIADLYQIAPDSAQLPDLKTLTPIKQICIRQLDIATRDFTEGFPGVTGLIEWFALSIKVKLTIPADGEYVLSVNSDDGSKLYLNNELVVNNDNLHATREISTTRILKAGVYDARIEYYQGPRFHIALELFWKQPGAAAKSYIPASYLKRP